MELRHGTSLFRDAAMSIEHMIYLLNIGKPISDKENEP